MFSVIIPVYNGAKFIDDAIKSVFSQTCSDFEIIVVNDGSTDNTAEVLSKYENTDKIRIIHKTNGGVSDARNAGMIAAKGEYFAFLDADDFWYENHLEVLSEMINNYPQAGLYATFAQINLEDGRQITTCPYFETHPETVYLENFFAEYHKDKTVKVFTTTATCISAKAYEKVGGFPVGCKIGEDLEHELRIAAYFPVAVTKRVTAVYEKRNSTATKDVSFDPDWGFLKTVDELYKDDEILPERKECLKLVMDWFKMRQCRHYVIDGRKKDAWKVFFQKNTCSKKDLLINLILLLLPCRLVRAIFAARWRNIG